MDLKVGARVKVLKSNPAYAWTAGDEGEIVNIRGESDIAVRLLKTADSAALRGNGSAVTRPTDGTVINNFWWMAPVTIEVIPETPTEPETLTKDGITINLFKEELEPITTVDRSLIGQVVRTVENQSSHENGMFFDVSYEFRIRDVYALGDGTLQGYYGDILRNDNPGKNYNSPISDSTGWQIAAKYLLKTKKVKLTAKEIREEMKKAKVAAEKAKKEELLRMIGGKRITKAKLAELEQIASLKEIPASKEYVRILTSQIGANIDQIPLIVFKKLTAIEDKADINEMFFDWYNSPEAKKILKGQELDEKTAKVLEDLIDISKTSYVKDIENKIKADSQTVHRLQEDIKVYLDRIVKNGLAIDSYADKKKFNMANSVKEIIKSGWFTFEKEKSKLTGSNNDNIVLVFSTKDVNIKYQKKELGLNYDVNVGSFFVNYFPYRGLITISVRENNILASGSSCCHPHINGSVNAGICWGNGNDAYVSAMKSLNPVKAFETLQSLIQAYGESPYSRIDNFQTRLNDLKPQEDKNGSKFKRHGSYKVTLPSWMLNRELADSPDLRKVNTNGTRDFHFWQDAYGGGYYIKTKAGYYINVASYQSSGVITVNYI